MSVKKINGMNWGVCGKMNTGKTYTTLELAANLQKLTNKPILIFDHANNPSYEGIGKVINTDWLEKRLMTPGITYRISGDTDLEYFLDLATRTIRQTIIILDDCGNTFTGNTSETQMLFITSAKNNQCDIFFQFHNFNDISPKLCRNFQMLVIKEQSTRGIRKEVSGYVNVNLLHEEVIEENRRRDRTKIWAYRIYDIYMDEVFWENPETHKLISESGSTYFEKYY